MHYLRVRRDLSGFSLIEMLMAIVILGIVASIAIPGFSGWIPNYKLRSAAMELYSNLQKVKMAAIRNNGEFAVVFDTGAGNYQIVNGGADRDYSTAGDNITEKTVTLSDHGGGVGYGNGNAGAPFDAARGFDNNVTFDDTIEGNDIVVFNARGLINAQANAGGEVYVSNSKDTAYTIGTMVSGLVYVRRWDGAAWE